METCFFFLHLLCQYEEYVNTLILNDIFILAKIFKFLILLILLSMSVLS